MDYTIEATCTPSATGGVFVARLLTGPDWLLRPVVDRLPVMFHGTSEEVAVAFALQWLRERHGIEPIKAGLRRVPFDPRAIGALVAMGRGWRYAQCPWCGTRYAAANRPDVDPPATVWTCPDCNQFSVTDEASARLEAWRGDDVESWRLVRQRIRRWLPFAAVDVAITVERLDDVKERGLVA